jgi:hypothetical protein
MDGLGYSIPYVEFEQLVCAELKGVPLISVPKVSVGGRCFPA